MRTALLALALASLALAQQTPLSDIPWSWDEEQQLHALPSDCDKKMVQANAPAIAAKYIDVDPKGPAVITGHCQQVSASRKDVNSFITRPENTPLEFSNIRSYTDTDTMPRAPAVAYSSTMRQALWTVYSSSVTNGFLYHSHGTQQSTAWGTPDVVAQWAAGDSVDYPSVATSRDNVYAVCRRYKQTGDPYGVFFYSSTNEGENWSNPSIPIVSWREIWGHWGC